MKVNPPETAVLCPRCGKYCYWDPENQNLVCIGCGAHFKAEDLGVKPAVNVEVGS